MKHLILSILLSIILTITCWTIGMFYFGLDLLLLPLMVLLFLIGLSGLLTIPFGIYRLIRKQMISKWLTLSVGLSIGFYLGFLVQKSIDSWDTKQRNLSGQILAEEIENYKTTYGTYPDSLTQLDLDELNKSLPKTYKMDRFTYFVRDGNYDLDIPIPIFDHWHWEKDKREFVYDDF